MDPIVWGSAKMRAWIVGGVIGVIGAVIASGIGFVSGVCCLFQFANILVPLGAGLIAGPIAAFMADWSGIPGEGAVGAGAGLGLRAGGLAAALSGLLGFLATLLIPILSQIFVLMGSDDMVGALVQMLLGMVMSMVFAAMFAGGGALVGLLLGAAGGAIVGAMKRQ